MRRESGVLRTGVIAVMTVGLVASGAWGATAAPAAPPANPTDQVTSPVTRAPSKGTIALKRTRPGATIVLTGQNGRKFSLSTSKAVRKKIPTGTYAISVIGLPGHRVIVNGGSPTLRVRPKAVTRLKVKVARLASVRLESVTTDGVSTTARVAASKRVRVQVEFLDSAGKAISRRTVTVQRGGKAVGTTAGAVAAQVRARALGSPGETQWVSLAPQSSLLTTTRPDVAVEAGSVEIEAPTSGTVVSVSRVNTASGAVVSDVRNSTQGGTLAIDDAPAPGTYEYRITGVNEAGEPTTTTLAVGVPDASGEGLVVMAPNTRRLTVTSIEYPKSGSGPVAIPLSALPAGTQASELVGDPLIAATVAGTSTAIGMVTEIRNERIWVRQTGLQTIFQQMSISGFSRGAVQSRDRRLIQPRVLKPTCKVDGVAIRGPVVEFEFEGPTADFGRWEAYVDGADVHLAGNFSMGASITLTGFTASAGVSCAIDNPPVISTVNVNIPTPIGPIPTVLTVKPFVDVEAKVTSEFGTYSRSIRLQAEFNVSDGWNGPKQHVAQPFTISGDEVPAQLADPSASVNIGGGLDFTYGLGQGVNSAGVQVGGVSLKVGPQASLTFSSGLAAGEPERRACLRGELRLAAATIEMQLAEVWGGTSSASLLDTVLFELTSPAIAEKTFACWGDPPPYVDTGVEGDMDGDGIRDKISFKVTKKSFPVKGILTVTASSTGKRATLDIGPDAVVTSYLGFEGTVNVDGRRGVEAVLTGVAGANFPFFVYVTLEGGGLQFVAPPGSTGRDDVAWYSFSKLVGMFFHLRRVVDSSVIVSSIEGTVRMDSGDRSDETLTITQYRWTTNGWDEIDKDSFRFRYPATIERNFDFEPYGTIMR